MRRDVGFRKMMQSITSKHGLIFAISFIIMAASGLLFTNAFGGDASTNRTSLSEAELEALFSDPNFLIDDFVSSLMPKDGDQKDREEIRKHVVLMDAKRAGKLSEQDRYKPVDEFLEWYFDYTNVSTNALKLADFDQWCVNNTNASNHTSETSEANHGLESTGAPPAAETPETHP